MPASEAEAPEADVAPGMPAAQAAAPDNDKALTYNMVVLQGLNKVTARVSTIEAPLGTVMRFGNLEVVARSCWSAPPEERPENAALLEIWELKSADAPVHIFTGWMFSSSPGLSALEHPVYDITILSCARRKDIE